MCLSNAAENRVVDLKPLLKYVSMAYYIKAPNVPTKKVATHLKHYVERGPLPLVPFFFLLFVIGVNPCASRRGHSRSSLSEVTTSDESDATSDGASPAGLARFLESRISFLDAGLDVPL